VSRGVAGGEFGGTSRLLAAGRAGDVRNEPAARGDDATIGADADREDRVPHVDAAVALLKVDVRHTVVRAGHGAADRHVIGIRAGQAELLPVAGDVLACRIGGTLLAGHADGRRKPQTYDERAAADSVAPAAAATDNGLHRSSLSAVRVCGR
jgi:hypothetical protein